MIYLILSLTIISSLAFADIYSSSVIGQDGAEGSIRTTDTLTMRTSSTLAVSADYKGNGTFEQMNCDSNTPPVDCALTGEISGVADKLTVNFKEYGSGIIKSIELYVDNKTPVISDLQAISLGWGAAADYIIRDAANDAYPAKCSGIKKVELMLNNKVVNSTSHTVGECTVTGRITGTISGYVGEANISLVAYDYMGFKANKTAGTITIDSTPPKIDSKAEVYRAGTTDKITKISTNSTKERTVDVMVKVTENETSLSGATGQFTELGANPNPLQASCVAIEGGAYACTFRNINFKPARTNPKIFITATDRTGSTATQNITLSFTAVNSAGEVTRLGPPAERCLNDKCYLAKESSLVIGSIGGNSVFNESNVRINGVQAKCNYSGSWHCSAMVPGSTSLSLSGEDDLGNKIIGKNTMTLVVDSNAPAIIGEIGTEPNCPTSSESLMITANVTEKESETLTIYSYTSAISSSNETKASCTKESTTGMWKCALSITGLKAEQINTNLEVVIEDMGGNKLVRSVPVSICVPDESVPNVITSITTRGTLPKIDKKVASKIDIKAPIGLTIKTNGVIIERSNIDCSKTPGAGSAYLINEESLSPTLILPLRYDKKWDTDDKVHVSCAQEFKVRSGNRIYTQYEREEINFTLVAYNQALGTVDEAYQDIIDEHKERLNEIDAHIAKLEKVDKILGKWCDLAEIAGKANGVIQSAKATVYAAFAVLIVLIGWTGIGTAGIESAWAGVETAAGKADITINRFIWAKGWVPIPGPAGNTVGLLSKSICMIYTCKFYDANTIVGIGISLAADAVSKQKSRIKDVAEKRAEYHQRLVDKAKEALKKANQMKESPNKAKVVAEAQAKYDAALNAKDTDAYTIAQQAKETAEEATLKKIQTSLDLNTVLKNKNLRIGDPGLFGTLYNQYNVDYASDLVANTEAAALAKSFSQINSMEVQAMVDNAAKSYADRNVGTWILNPYKSTHFDSLCIPAKIFNDQKEKQLICQHLACLQEVAKSGGGLESCDYDYGLGMCLYVDSAEYKINPCAWKSFWKNILPAFGNAIAGNAFTIAYLFATPPPPLGCIMYQIKFGNTLNLEFLSGGFKGAFCGVTGTIIAAKELAETFKTKFKTVMVDSSPTKLNGHDFCSGVSYSE